MQPACRAVQFQRARIPAGDEQGFRALALTGKLFEDRVVMSELLLVEAVAAFNESLPEDYWLGQNRSGRWQVRSGLC